jgi:NADH-quinone oxidoreductase subunit L
LRWAPIASFAIAVVQVFTLATSFEPEQRFFTDDLYTWISAGDFHAELSFLLDPLSAVMVLVVTGVGSLIHIYAVGYMDDDHREDKGFQRFFVYLNLFTFSMLMLVLGDNLLVMFVGWEGVGLCSYLLIGFWYLDDANAAAGQKAFVVNRIGDFGFLLGIFLLFWSFASVGAPTVEFREMAANVGLLSDPWSRCRAGSRSCPASQLGSSRSRAAMPVRGRVAVGARSPCTCGCPTRWPADAGLG